MVKSCINCGQNDTRMCKGCETTAKPNAAPSNWVPAKDIDVPTNQDAKRGATDTNVGHNQEAKADGGKLDLTLVPTQIIRDIAQVREYGTNKYGDPDNWKKVELERYIKALMRHTLDFLDDRGSVDQESGIPHYKHMACNMAFICQLMEGKHGD